MSTFTFYQVNAFTREGMQVLGNPATVCLVDEFPADRVMKDAARILASPMTSFLKRTSSPIIFDLRHFSPDGKENHVCGHATQAAAELLATLNPDLRKGAEIIFNLNPKYKINDSNSFVATIHDKTIHLTLPAITAMEQVLEEEFYSLLADALRIARDDIAVPSYYVPRIINYVVELKDQDVLLAMKPDFKKLKDLALSAKFPHEGVMATAQSKIPGYDILTRVFLPVIDVDEDIACGSANCSVTPYWAHYRKELWADHKTNFKALFPYPPGMDQGFVGGIQELSIDFNKAAVVVTGQARYEKIISISLSYPPSAQAVPPRLG